MAQRLIPVLVFLVVLAFGGAVLLWRGWRQRMLEERLYGTGTPLRPRRGLEEGYSAARTIGTEPESRVTSTVEQIGRAVSGGKTEKGLRQWLARAGYYEDSAPTIYVGAQLMLGLLALVLGGALAFSFEMTLMIRACVMVAVLAAFALLPNLVVTLKRRKRTANVRSHLPDAIDLLEICVSSGMGLDMAWNSVCEEIRGVSPVLADEMALSNLEMHLARAASRRAAKHGRAHRC